MFNKLMSYAKERIQKSVVPAPNTSSPKHGRKGRGRLLGAVGEFYILTPDFCLLNSAGKQIENDLRSIN